MNSRTIVYIYYYNISKTSYTTLATDKEFRCPNKTRTVKETCSLQLTD